MASKTLPNEPCPCGSGQKFKRCCMIEDQTSRAKRRRNRLIRNAAIVAGLAGLGLLFAYNTTWSEPDETPVAPLRSTSTPGSAPPGPAPAGKVWSEEHGHWHDAPGATPNNTQTNYTPPPPGDPPPGKVWSTAHGHWHDAPAAGATPATPNAPVPQPPGEAPEGKVWSEEHGHWHDIQPTQNQ